MKHRSIIFLAVATLALFSVGCSLFPAKRERDAIHNPFPQIKRIAVLPFYNQSSEPTVDTQAVTEAYYAALQSIPGFEVLPVGVAKIQWMQYSRAFGEPAIGADFQRLAQLMGVEAVVVGSVTDFNAYYPPRMALTTHWYAANEGFHPIPPGYGLPWGTDAEKKIPKRITREAEFELARSQLATQAPVEPELPIPMLPGPVRQAGNDAIATEPLPGDSIDPAPAASAEPAQMASAETMLPPNWPDPSDLIPDPPAIQPPTKITNHDPVLTHTRLYRGDDAYFTTRLADYVETGDDARPRGWQGYLKRSDDFVRFCCHLHLVEMLESRGGRDQSDLILEWQLSRY